MTEVNEPTQDRAGVNRRRFLGYSAAGAGALALAACGGPSTAKSSTSSGASAEIDFKGVKPAATIDMWSTHPGKSQPVETQLVDKFNSSQNAIKVNLVTAGASYADVAAKFTAALQGGQLPGLVLFSDVWWFRYFLNKTIIPLDSLIKTLDIDMADFETTLIKDYQYGGQQWALPYARSTPLFFYNKSHWSKAGLPDRAPKTWQEFESWVPKLKAADLGTVHQYHYGSPANDYPAWTFQNMAWGWGGEYSDGFTMKINSAETAAAGEFMRKSINVDKWAGVAANAATDDFSAQSISACISSTGGIVGVIASSKFDLGVGPVPGGPKASTKVCPTGGAGLGIPAQLTKEQQLAAGTFLKFLTLPENNAAFASATGYMPYRKSADKLLADRITQVPQIGLAIKQLPSTRSQDDARVFIATGDQIIQDGLVEIMTQNADSKTAFAKVQTNLTQAFTTTVKPKLPK